jgi:hypothetical protein
MLLTYFSHITFNITIFKGWTRSDFLQLSGILIGGLITIFLSLLNNKLTDKQRLDHRLQIDEVIGDELNNIRYNESSDKAQLYNTKLINKKYFTNNTRNIFWGYPYHAAGLYSANFDGLEFVTVIEEWEGKKYYKVGVVPYDRILGVKTDGDSSFNGLIFC